MSSITEKARAEAEEAEREEHENDEDQDDLSNGDKEQEPALEPHPGDGLEEPSDAMIAELRAAVDEHHDHVHAIMGPFVEAFQACETCNGIGLAYPQPAAPKLEMAEGLELCPACKGTGELATPSKRSGFDVIQCVTCRGQGYTGNLAAPPAAAVEQAVATYPVGSEQQPPPPPAPPAETTDPRVEALRAEGYIVMERPTT